MSKKPNQPDPLRTKAEAQLARAPATEGTPRPAEELLHELRVHQIELEMQNENLRQAQIALEESRDRYLDLYELAPVGYLTLTRNGMINEMNLTGTMLLGMERNKLLQHRFASLVAPEYRDRWNRHFLSALEHGDKLACELALRHGDWHTFHVRLDCVRLVKEGAAPVVHITLTDITERKRMEEAIIEAGERFYTLFNSISDSVFITGMDGRFILVNRSACERLGYNQEELLQMGPADIDTPEYAAKVPERIKALQERGELVLESAHVRKDGVVIPIELSNRIVDYDGKPVIMGVARDITGRKQVERQLRDLAAHLQATREEEKTSIAREIHDDMGGTLTALKMEAYWLADELSANKEAAPLLEHTRLISQLTDDATNVMRRIITGLRPSILDDLGLPAALEWQAAQFHQRTGIECRVNCVTDEDYRKNLDKKHSICLFRIFQESLVNVSRHSGASRVEVEFHQGNKDVFLSISDNGRGIPEKHVVAPTSFGLLGMTERAEQLGGSIKFGSSPNGGLSVTVILPSRRQQKREEA